MSSAPLRTHVLDNIYVGLAKLCAAESVDNSGQGAIRAVVVCVDDLGPDEFEFFTVLGRRRPDLPVFVYGDERSESKAARALERGAKGRATVEAILTAISDVAVSPDEGSKAGHQPATPALRESDLDLSTEAADPPVVERFTDEEAEEEPREDEPPAGPVRVPWLSYENKPRRSAPRRQAPPAAKAESSATDASDEEPAERDEPLLTEAELQALIGDDIAAIAPKQSEGTESNDYGRGESRA